MQFNKSVTDNNVNNNNSNKKEVSNMTNNNSKNTIATINVNFAVVFANQKGKVDNKVVFTAFINDIMLSDLELITTKDGKEFLSFPKRKAEVKGQENYYNRVYFKYTQEDLEKIKKAINKYDDEKGIKVIG